MKKKMCLICRCGVGMSPACGLLLLLLPIALWVGGCNGGWTGGAAKTEILPVVACNTKSKEFLVAYLVNVQVVGGTHQECRIKRFDASGKQIGSILTPFGEATHVAVGRPVLAYSPKSDCFFVAVIEHVTGTLGQPSYGAGAYYRVLGRFLHSSGANLIGPEFLFEAGPGGQCSDIRWIQLAHNSIDNEFVVTADREFTDGSGVKSHEIVAQRITQQGSIGKPKHLVASSVSASHPHALAYAPVPSPSSPNGRFLLVRGDAWLVRDDLSSTLAVPIEYGNEKGGVSQEYVTYGVINGKKRFLVAYSDNNNCVFPLEKCSKPEDQWTGVWGLCIDPAKQSSVGPKAAPFAISYIWKHVTAASRDPSATFVPGKKAFFVVWREVPVNIAQNKEKRSHIRGNKVDYLVSDGSYGVNAWPKPHANVVISPVSGSCPTPNQACYSNEDPINPSVDALDAGKVAVVWQQRVAPGAKEYEIKCAVWTVQ